MLIYIRQPLPFTFEWSCSNEPWLASSQLVYQNKTSEAWRKLTQFTPAMLARVLAMTLFPASVCPCLSVTSWCSIEVDGWIELVFLACRLPATYSTLCSKEIQVATKIGVLPLELCPKFQA